MLQFYNGSNATKIDLHNAVLFSLRMQKKKTKTEFDSSHTSSWSFRWLLWLSLDTSAKIPLSGGWIN